MSITRHKKRFWAVWDADGTLICVCVYKKGAHEVVRLLGCRAGEETVDASATYRE